MLGHKAFVGDFLSSSSNFRSQPWTNYGNSKLEYGRDRENFWWNS